MKNGIKKKMEKKCSLAGIRSQDPKISNGCLIAGATAAPPGVRFLPPPCQFTWRNSANPILILWGSGCGEMNNDRNLFPFFLLYFSISKAALSPAPLAASFIHGQWLSFSGFIHEPSVHVDSSSSQCDQKSTKIHRWMQERPLFTLPIRIIKWR